MSSSSRKYMSKRQRPCDFCRSRKTACRIEGSLPCRSCMLHERQCTFIDATRPRKPLTATTDSDAITISKTQPSRTQNENSIIDTVAYQTDVGHESSIFTNPQNAATSPSETRLGDRLDTGNPSAAFTDQVFTGLEGTLPDAEYSPNFPGFDANLSPNDLLAGIHPHSSTSWLDTQSMEMQLLDTNDGLYPQIIGHSGDMDPYLLQNYQYDLFGTFRFKQLTIHSVCQSGVPTQFLLSQPGLFSSSRQEMGVKTSSSEDSRNKLESLVSQDTGSRLIALFRKFVLPQYPIFSECAFPDAQSSPPHLLAAIYMISQPFSRFDNVLSIELAYENLNTQALYGIVYEMLRYEAHNPNLATIQTLLLTILRPSTNPLILESAYKWHLHGTLVSASQTLGLHYDPTSWTIARWQIALRRRLSFTIFATDKWLAASLGRPPLIKQDDWLVTSLSMSDNHMSSLNSALWPAHLQYSRLGSLMGDVLEKLFSLRAVKQLASNIETTLSLTQGFLQELSDWHREFESQPSEHDDAALPVVCILGYHYLRMTIFRAAMRPLLTDPHHNPSTPDATNTTQSGRADLVSFVRTGIRSTTTAAATFVKSLHENHFHMLWPHWSQVAFSCICFLDLLMAVSSLSTEEALIWFDELHDARREIRLKSAMLPVLRLGLLRIDALFWKGIDKVLHLLPHVQDALQASLESSRA